VSELKLNSPLQFVKGVGPKKSQVLAGQGFTEVKDILYYFPRHYLDRTSVTPIGELKIDESATIIGRVKAHGLLYGRKRRYEVMLEDDSGAINLVWFHGINFWSKLFKKNQLFAATGYVKTYMGLQMIHPDLERLEDETDTMIHAGRIIPVYPQTAEFNKVGLNSKSMRRITTFIFENLTEKLSDHLPKDVCKSNNFLDLHSAVSQIHYPDKREYIEKSRRRLAFDELLNFQFLVFKNKDRKNKIVKELNYSEQTVRLNNFTKNLPFELTDGQKKVWNEIKADLISNQPMYRMLQGDVGCGKTVVAVMASLFVASNKHQTAFMAPTEILAEQHYRNWKKPLEELNISSALLTSSLKQNDKKEIAEQCSKGEIEILFGTHALIYDYVSFLKLGLVIIDEQHRFGVKQRGKLHAKGNNPDLLVMTATPIPRTLALTLYGDLDISTIETLPAGRKPIKTVWRSSDVKDKIYDFIIEDVKKSGQTYIVYPLIEKSEQLELENVEDAFKDLSKGKFKELKLGMVHGKVKNVERDKIIYKFFNQELDVLLATTVIEVGMDNPNATIMVIEHAERFGLAQLHQLRGRIGRGTKQATLIAIAYTPLSEISQKRLDYFVSTTDGFKIAEADLELRGPGELYGIRQSGVPIFKTVRISQDLDLLENSRSLLEMLFNPEINLDSEYKYLYKYLDNNVVNGSIMNDGA
jgi:ATP-dependent DNA helicase RecG